MKKTYDIRPVAVSVKLYELVQMIVISGVVDEDSLSHHLDTDNALTHR